MAKYPRQNGPRRPDRFVPSALLGGCAAAALDYTGPLLLGSGINLLAALAWVIVALSVLAIVQDGLRFGAEYLDRIAATTPTGLHGTAAFATYKDIESEFVLDNWGPYWGAFQGRSVIIGYQSNAVSVGTSGSGKDSGVIQISCLTNPHSKTIVDFKGTAASVLARTLRERGEIVHILDFGELYPEIYGPSAFYNTLDFITDHFWKTENGLQYVSADCLEIATQLLPEPSGGDSNGNGHFRTVSRKIIAFAIQIEILLRGYDANLPGVRAILEDQAALLRYALWAAGRLHVEGKEEPEAIPLHESPWVDRHDPATLANYRDYLRGLGASIASLLEAENSKAYENFIVGAQNALEGFDQTSRASKITAKSTFRFADQKEGGAPVTVFLVADPSRMEAQSKVLGLVQWCMLQEWKRHANKSRPVYLMANEATNFRINGADSLMTWGREFGIRIHWAIQSLSAFRKVYGKEALHTLLSETEIKQFLPAQRDPETLKLIEELLGRESIVTVNFNGRADRPGFGLDGFGYQEQGRALRTADEIRREKHQGLLFVRDNFALLTDQPPIAAIDPYRDQIDVNPVYGKPWLLPTELVIKQRGKPFPGYKETA